MATLTNTPPRARNMMPPISMGASTTAHTWAMPFPLQASNHLLALNSERYKFGFLEVHITGCVYVCVCKWGGAHLCVCVCVSPTQDSNQEPMK